MSLFRRPVSDSHKLPNISLKKLQCEFVQYMTSEKFVVTYKPLMVSVVSKAMDKMRVSTCIHVLAIDRSRTLAIGSALGTDHRKR